MLRNFHLHATSQALLQLLLPSVFLYLVSQLLPLLLLLHTVFLSHLFQLLLLLLLLAILLLNLVSQLLLLLLVSWLLQLLRGVPRFQCCYSRPFH
jgi:hypothetical protein